MSRNQSSCSLCITSPERITNFVLGSFGSSNRRETSVDLNSWILHGDEYRREEKVEVSESYWLPIGCAMEGRWKGILILFVYSNQVQQQPIFTPITFQSTIVNCSFKLLLFFFCLQNSLRCGKSSVERKSLKRKNILRHSTRGGETEVSGRQDKLFSHSKEGFSQISTFAGDSTRLAREDGN